MSAVRRLKLFRSEIGSVRRPLSIFDLLLFTLIAGVHLAHLPLAVDFSNSPLTLLIPLVPTLAAVWIQLRFRLRTLQATLTHYTVCVVWAFLYGYGYCLTLNGRQASTPTHGRIFDPFSWALDDMREMAVFALLTSAMYAGVSRFVLRRANRKIAPMTEARITANHDMHGSTACDVSRNGQSTLRAP
ncbi:hypothetical protein K227x_14340 [Rubripirellula lacrimiformis]|uniref:Uncharacterized protein n=1 Tax=Rubripirellula lacrimiformis TaxID=1930273 RepID=A0A517N7E7_9BACT|nr:hypothetical protein K227x_14340 [Rubripirellula lacrimiformis]